MRMSDQIRKWFADAADLAVAAAATPVIREGAALFADQIRVAQARAFEARTFEVLGRAGTVSDTPLGVQFASLAPSLPWSVSSRWDDGGRERALCVVGDMFALRDVVAGLVYLDGGGTYPEHDHPPQELYLTVAGTARWRFGGSPHYVEVEPSATLYNKPGDRHAIEAGATPLVAMYVLWGDGVSGESGPLGNRPPVGLA